MFFISEYYQRKKSFPVYQAGGAAMNAIIKTEVAVNKVGIIKTPHQPM
jgi:hypothetical protein